MEDQFKIRDILLNSNIDYSMKTINRNSSSAFNDTRARTGTLMQKMNIAYEYIFYVSKSNYERASQAINVTSTN